MTILTALQSAAMKLVGQRPGTFFGSTGQLEQELSDLVNEAGEDISKYQDWQALVRVANLPADGVSTEFEFPADYSRMTQAAVVQQPTAWFWGYYHCASMDEFLFFKNRGFEPWPGVWYMYDNKFQFQPAPPADGVEFPYVSKNFARDANGILKANFDNDTDEFLLPERLLMLWLVWRWRENKKLDSSGDQEAFIKALDEYAVKDGGSRRIARNARRLIPNTRVGWPWELGTPGPGGPWF